MTKTTPFVSDDCTLYLHVAGGGTAVLEFKTELGDPRDVSLDQVRFMTEHFEQDLANGDTADLKELTLLGSDLPLDYIDAKVDYLVLDMSQTPPATVMEGKLVLEGWN